VRTDAKFRPAFYLALRDTLVADNLDKATAASFGADRSGKAKFRVVTKAGEIIDVR
jgi:structural maintenance of chromosome 4